MHLCKKNNSQKWSKPIVGEHPRGKDEFEDMCVKIKGRSPFPRGDALRQQIMEYN